MNSDSWKSRLKYIGDIIAEQDTSSTRKSRVEGTMKIRKRKSVMAWLKMKSVMALMWRSQRKAPFPASPQRPTSSVTNCMAMLETLISH